MKGNEAVMAKLQEALTSELTAICQYVVHAGIQENWEYEKLSAKIMENARKEMEHLEKIIDRMVFLGSVPSLSTPIQPRVGMTVQEQLTFDLELEEQAVVTYNAAAAVAEQFGDTGSFELFSDNLEDEEEHVKYLEAQLAQIEQMGIQNYLSLKA